jgi:hypothetical protein
MSQDLLTALKQQKEFLLPETYKRLKANIDKIPEEVKKQMVVQLQNAAHLKKMIDEYEDQRVEVLKGAFTKFKDAGQSYADQYNDAMQKVEEQEKEMALKNAEESLGKL